MGQRYVAIDFETANAQRASPCSVGMVLVDGGRVMDTWSTLIDPEQPFSGFNVAIHGIRPDDVEGAPTFPEVLPRIVEIAREAGTLVAHSASFDVQVLTGTAFRYGLVVDEVRFACTWVFARHWWPGWPSYSLGYVVDRLGFADELAGPGHHDALWDAAAAAEIVRRGWREQAVRDWEEAAAKVGVRLGICGGPTYKGCVTKHGGGGSKIDPTRDPTAEVDPEHPLFGVTVCFTGSLEQFSRREAAQIVVDNGGEFASSVNKHVDLLVVGRQDLAKLNGADVSAKMRKATDMAAGGHWIEIICEADFYRLIAT